MLNHIGKDPKAMNALLAPTSVAIVGASDRPGNLGGAAVRYLQRFAYAGSVWPVNPGHAEVAGLRSFASLAELPSVPDLAILAVPAERLLEAIADCVQYGVRAGIAWAGGFAEAGSKGQALQLALEELCRRHDFLLCGPNCLGVINSRTGFTGTFTTSLQDMEHLNPGSVAMVSQSGGLAMASMALAQRTGMGFGRVVSCGNEAVLSVADFVHAFAMDDETKVIAVYVEAVGDGPAFIDALAAARDANKPVVILKGGASAASSRAALAHTGRLAGADRAFDAIFHETAAIRVYSVEEMLDLALLLSTLDLPAQLPAGRGVAVTTFGGGAGVLATDQCEQAGLAVPELAQATRDALASQLTPLAAIGNPVDLTPQSVNDARWLALLPDALGILPSDPAVDAVLFLSSAMKQRSLDVIKVLQALRQKTRKPIVVGWPLASNEALATMSSAGIFAFPENARAARALGNLVRYADRLREPAVPVRAGLPVSIDWESRLPQASEGEPIVVSEHIVSSILRSAGLPVAAGDFARTADEAMKIASRARGRWAIKGISPQIPHRAAAGLVALGVDAAEAGSVHQRFVAIAQSLGVTLEGTYLQEMVSGSELLISAFRDPIFGVMIACGVGGNLAEYVDDVAISRAPIDEAGAATLIDRLRITRSATGGLSEAARKHAARFAARLSELAMSAPWARFTLEVNPLKCADTGAVAVDGLLIVDSAELKA